MASHLPLSPLRPYIDFAVGYSVAASPTGVHRGLPSRSVTLVIELLAPLRVTAQRNAVAAHGVVGGLQAAPAMIDASGPQEGLQYGLSPLAAASLCGAPAGELSGIVVGLEQLLGPAGRELVEQVAAAPSWRDRFGLVDAALLQRLATPPAVAPQVAEAWRLLFADDGRTPVSALAQQVGWSRRHLSEQFGHVTGLTPKQASRIARFSNAHRMLTSQPRPSLARVAADCGYADQPHLAREWKALAGCTISTWLREELPFVQDNAMHEPAPSAA